MSRRTYLRRFTAGLALFGLLNGLGSFAYAAGEPGLARIRDAEIEQYLRQWETPVWKAAGLSPDAMNIVLVNDNEINSFVAGGQNIFVYTGLLLRSDNANQVVGVLAHETGHIAGGHLARMGEAIEKAEIVQILGVLLGAAGMIAGGGGAGAAGAGAGASLAERSFLSFSRTQERSADQAAVNFLERTGQSARGLLDFFKKLEGQELLSARRQDPYLLTHPLTEDRITFIQHFLQDSKYADAPEPAAYKEEFARMTGKLIGFLWPVPRVFQRYKEADNSIEARYARSIAEHRLGNESAALKLIDSLLAEKSNDPYFNELKGQFLFEGGKVHEAVAPYQRANQLLPHNPLIETEMAQAMVESGNPRFEKEALAALEDAAGSDKDNSLTWRMIATIRGRQGDEGGASLALAEEAYTEGRYREARGQAKRAQKLLPVGSPGALRAQDIEQAASKAIKDSRR